MGGLFGIDLGIDTPDIDIPGMFGEFTDWGGEVVGTPFDVGGSIGGGISGGLEAFTKGSAKFWSETLGMGAEGLGSIGGGIKDMLAPITGLLGNPMLLLVLGGGLLVVLMVMK